MGSRRVIIELSPSALEVAVCRGGTITASRRVPGDRGDWPEHWKTAVDELAPALRSAVEELGCAGLPATVVYTLAGSTVTTGAYPLSVGRAGAVRAATLALTSVSGAAAGGCSSDARILAVDHGTDAQARIHTLAAGDAPETLDVLAAWVAQAGLRLEGAIPAGAVYAASAAAAAIGTSDEATRAVLWLGEHAAALAVASRGRLHFVRNISSGLEALIEALMRPIRPRNADTITLLRSEADSLLAAVGIPSPQQELPGLAGCDGACILPLLQPVLQRLTVEVKQSLRFGLDDAAKAGVSLTLAGPGAGIPGLGAALARQAGVAAGDACDCGPDGRTAAQAAVHTTELPVLMGSAAGEALLHRGLRKALLAGVAAAAALVAVEGVTAHLALEREREWLAAVKVNQAGSRAMDEVQQAALSARMSATALEARIRQSLGQSPEWATVLAVIAERTPETVRLTSLELGGRDGGNNCTLRGYLALTAATDAADELRRFVETLADAPVIDAVRLGITQRTSIRGEQAQAFELTLELVPLPPRDDLFRTAAAGPTEGAP